MAAFKEIYQEYGKKVYRFLLSLTGSPQEAEELLQETFYQAFLHVDKFEGRCSVYTWLCQIGKNAWLQERRRKSRFSEKELGELTLADNSLSPEDISVRREEYERIRRAVHRLEEPYREVFVMHVFGGVKLREIALQYGKTESWARVTYYRAKQKICEDNERGKEV